MNVTLLPSTRRSSHMRLLLVEDSRGRWCKVWFTLKRPAPWRCSVHGAQRTPECIHTHAAAPVLIREMGLS
jgi:hypothetical protein